MSCGTQAQDFRPGDPDGAWLLRSSLWIITYLAVLPPARQPALSPVLRMPWRRPLLPNFPERAPAADAFTGVLPLPALPPGSSSLPGPTVSWLREELYPRRRPMSTPATIDFSTFMAEVSAPDPPGSIQCRRRLRHGRQHCHRPAHPALRPAPGPAPRQQGRHHRTAQPDRDGGFAACCHASPTARPARLRPPPLLPRESRPRSG
jgi:hypothetical protein